MIIFAFKEEELKEKTQDANFSLPNKNPASAIKKRIPDSDSKIGQKLGGFRILIANPNLYYNLQGITGVDWSPDGYHIVIFIL